MKFHLALWFIALAFCVVTHGKSVSSEESGSSSSEGSRKEASSTKSSSSQTVNYESSSYTGESYSSGSKTVTSEYSSSSTIEERSASESVESYCKRVFTQRSNEDKSSYFTRIFRKYSSESDLEYIARIDTIHYLFKDLEIWNNVNYLEIIKSYYTLKYGRYASETDEAYFTRILRKDDSEDYNSYKSRIEIVKKVYPNLKCWSSFKFDQNSSLGYTLKTLSNSKTTVEKRSTTVVEERSASESVESYCKRVFTQRSNEDKSSYFTRIFRKYSSESDLEYIARIDTIHYLFKDLEIWNNVNYLEIIKSYYTLKYGRYASETDEAYFTRILRKDDSEDYNSYKSRIEIVKKVYPNLKCWSSFEFDQNSSLGYTLKTLSNSKTTVEKRSTTVVENKESNNRAGKIETEKKIENTATIIRRGGSKTTKPEETSKTVTVTIEKRNVGESDKEYCERVYGRKSGETDETYYYRITTKGTTESDYDYVQRINLIRNSLTGINLFKEAKYSKFLENYYKLNFAKTSTESLQEYYTRLLRRQVNEDIFAYKVRIEYLKKLFNNLECWKTFEFDESSESGYKVITTKTEKRSTTTSSDTKGTTTQKRSTESSVTVVERKTGESDKEYCERVYGRKSGESDETYYYRITTKTTTESDYDYVQRINLIRTSLTGINLFKEAKYSKFLENYYKLKFAKTSTESLQEYYTRLLTREVNEDIFAYKVRIEYLKKLFKNLECWKTFEFDESSESGYKVTTTKTEKRSTTTSSDTKGTTTQKRSTESSVTVVERKTGESDKEYCERVYGRKSGESDETYYYRITTKTTTESDYDYVQRINLIRTSLTGINLFKEAKYSKFLENYYKLKFAKTSTESLQEYYTRLLTREVNEDIFAYKVRIEYLKKLFKNLECWKTFEFDESSESGYKVTTTKTEKRSTTTSSDTKGTTTQKRSTESSVTVVERKTGESDKEYCERVYGRKSGESDETYYYRITTKTTTESDYDYVQRINLIRTSLTGINLFKEAKYSKFLENYYKLKFAKTSTESLQEYYTRLLTREVNEDIFAYKVRIEYLKKLFKNLECWKTFEFDESSESGYKVTTTKTEKRSTTTSSDTKGTTTQKRSTESSVTVVERKTGESDQEYCERVYGRKSGESDETYYYRITTKTTTESDYDYVQRINLIRTSLTGINLFKEAKYSKFLENYYKLKFAKTSTESLQEYYTRLLTREVNEDIFAYKVRIEYLKKLFKNLECWKTFEFDESSESGYKVTTTKTEKRSTTTSSDTKGTTTQKRSTESSVTVVERKTGESDQEYCERVYGRKSGESDETYYYRITTKGTTESDYDYVQRINLIRTSLTGINLFKEAKYSKFLENYYKLKFAKTSTESLQEYFTRLLTREVKEDIFAYKVRIEYLKKLFKNLECWKTFEFDESSESGYKVITTKTEKRSTTTSSDTKGHTSTQKRSTESSVTVVERNSGESDREYCERVYGRKSGESDETYYYRITTKGTTESDYDYVQRINLIRTSLIGINLFKEAKYSKFLENYYKLKFAKTITESLQEYFTRLLTREVNEDIFAYKVRIEYLKKLFKNLECWKTFAFDESSSSGYKLIKSTTIENKSSKHTHGKEIKKPKGEHKVTLKKKISKKISKTKKSKKSGSSSGSGSDESNSSD